MVCICACKYSCSYNFKNLFSLTNEHRRIELTKHKFSQRLFSKIPNVFIKSASRWRDLALDNPITICSHAQSRNETLCFMAATIRLLHCHITRANCQSYDTLKPSSSKMAAFYKTPKTSTTKMKISQWTKYSLLYPYTHRRKLHNS